MTEQPSSKNWDPVKHPLFAKLVGGSTPLPPPSRKGGRHIMIDSRTYQKQNILLSARQKSSNYLEPSKENVLVKYDAATLSMFYLKFFMIWFHKIFKLIFQTQPPCPRNVCTGPWRKLPNLTAFLEIFLYLANSNSAEHV